MLVNLNKVVDVRQWKLNEKNVYIGRKKDIFERSKWANPYRITRTNGRKQAVLKFVQYLRSNTSLLKDIHQLKGANRGCWCVPKLCHANILLKLTKYINSEEQYQSDMESLDFKDRSSLDKQVYATLEAMNKILESK